MSLWTQVGNCRAQIGRVEVDQKAIAIDEKRASGDRGTPARPVQAWTPMRRVRVSDFAVLCILLYIVNTGWNLSSNAIYFPVIWTLNTLKSAKHP